jgi:hypothetical protein
MKLIITESQKDKIVKKLIFKYLDNRNYNQLEIDDRIYFVKNVGDQYADILFDKSDGGCYIHYDLVSFFSRMMGVKPSDIKEVIGRWVEHTLQMEVKDIIAIHYYGNMLVEHTLQMKGWAPLQLHLR